MKEELQQELAWVVELHSNPAPFGHEVIEQYVFPFPFCICPSLTSAVKRRINYSLLAPQDRHRANLAVPPFHPCIPRHKGAEEGFAFVEEGCHGKFCIVLGQRYI